MRSNFHRSAVLDRQSTNRTNQVVRMSATSFSLLIAACFVLVSGVTPEHGNTAASFTPIVLWHGMGDSCCFSFSLGHFQKQLNQTLPGVYIHSIRIGNSLVSDVESGYFKHPDEQIAEACSIIGSDPKLANGYNAIGFSQGSQFLRGLVQRCPTPKMKTLISLGGQHQGVYGLPHCGSLSHPSCDYLRRLLNHAAYLEWVQRFLVQATYWHDPLNEKEYKKSSTFLADINNERTLNVDYIQNLRSLEKLVFVKFENDSMVQPVESEWFGFYKPGQAEEVAALQQSDIYLEDRLGLQKMDADSKLHFLSTPGDHLQFSWDWFQQNIVDPFLRN